jgi:hypothetical protein
MLCLTKCLPAMNALAANLVVFVTLTTASAIRIKSVSPTVNKTAGLTDQTKKEVLNG